MKQSKFFNINIKVWSIHGCFLLWNHSENDWFSLYQASLAEYKLQLAPRLHCDEKAIRLKKANGHSGILWSFHIVVVKPFFHFCLEWIARGNVKNLPPPPPPAWFFLGYPTHCSSVTYTISNTHIASYIATQFSQKLWSESALLCKPHNRFISK